jgi:hypothetical protein
MSSPPAGAVVDDDVDAAVPARQMTAKLYKAARNRSLSVLLSQ